jgi:hypothetical protein
VRCVVCQASLADGAERYANAWEKSRRRFPCCASCVDTFDPDVHWIPARFVDPPTTGERMKILQTFGKRMGGGDNPRAVVREALLAGIAPAELREGVEGASAYTAEQQSAADGKTILGFFSLLMFGRGTVTESRDQRTARAFREALDDLDAWEKVSAGRA